MQDSVAVGSAPDHVIDVSVGAWMPARLGPRGSVGGLVPVGFDSYIRVGHHDGAEEHDFGVTRETLAVLCDVIGRSGAVDQCLFAIWDGYGWVNGGGGMQWGWAEGVVPDPKLMAATEAAYAAPAFADGVLGDPKLSLSGRSYYLFEGPLDSALEVGKRSQVLDREHFEPHVPDLIWPRDHSWFIGTDTDLWFAYIGGSDALVCEIAADPRLDARPVSTSDWFGEVEPH
jgi:hypothetical protein